MSKVKCPGCGTRNRRSNEECTKCRLTLNPGPAHWWLLWALIALGIAYVVGRSFPRP